MVTKKTTKKTPTKSKAPVKAKSKATAKAKAPVKKAAPAKRTAKRSSASRTSEREFMSMQTNRETAYWVVLGVVVVVFGVWVNNLQMDIQEIYDQIDASTMNQPVNVTPKKP